MFFKKVFVSCSAAIGMMMGVGIEAAMAEVLAVDNLIQLVSKDSATSKTISWQSDESRYNYHVEYRRKGTTEGQQAFVTSPKRAPIYESDSIPPYTYGAYMQKLEPQTAYEYRIYRDDDSTGWFSFTTTSETLTNYKVLIFGDSQSVDYRVWGQTANTAWHRNQDAAFFVNMGDLTDNGQAWYQWREWAYEADILTSHLPFAPVLGNHEAYSLEWTYAQPYMYKAFFAVPYGSPIKQNRMAYSFNYGDVHYVSLNTDYEELHEDNPGMLKDEAVWLETDLAEAVKANKRIIILMHRPPWNSPYDGSLDINGQYFMPIFDKYNVPLVFTAHEHCYERTVPIKNNQQAQTGTVYIATGRSGTEIWDGSRKKPEDVIYYNPTDMPMYVTLQVEPASFHVTAVKADGTVIDDAVIETEKENVAKKKEIKRKNLHGKITDAVK